MNTNDKLYFTLDTPNDEQPEEIPNEETLAAMQEAEDIASGRITAKVYSSAKEMLDDIFPVSSERTETQSEHFKQ